MNNNFSENLKKIRKDNNLSQEQLAEELGVSRQAISKWESSVAYPEMDKIIALCDKFNLNIDDLLHKDIREIKGEEETKKNLNKYIDDFLNFITSTINMFSNMSFKSKVKCLLEEIIIAIILFSIFIIIGLIGQDLLFGIFGFLPDQLYYVMHSIIQLIYVLFSFLASLLIMVHIYKTRYLDYYEKIKKEDITNNDINESEVVDSQNIKIDKKNKILFKKNESKIIIRDPKHSEYKFINGLLKSIVGIIKFFALCFSVILFVILIGLVFGFVISFLIYKTGFVFIGLLVLLLAAAVIDIIVILMILNFVFNRKNDKKKMIWTFILSLIVLGVGAGLISIGTLNFEYVDNDVNILETSSKEFTMNDKLFFDSSARVEYVELDIDNVKIEYSINKYCDVSFSSYSESGIHAWGYCSRPIKMVKEIINNFNDKKIIEISNEIKSFKIYASKTNIDILKSNRENYYKLLEDREDLVNSYENRINELQHELDEYAEKVWKYEEEIANLKDQINMYESEE